MKIVTMKIYDMKIGNEKDALVKHNLETNDHFKF